MSSKAKSVQTKKRAREDDAPQDGPSTKTPKLFPLFGKSGTTSESADFRWESSLGSAKTCLHGVNLTPIASQKVACFDLDGCLIESSFASGKKAKGSSTATFRWWRPTIPTQLKGVHESGYTIVIVTNQALRGRDVITEWKKKIPAIAAALPGVPFHIYAATAKDGYRKPMLGIWYELEQEFAKSNVQIDREKSFFVGDAAGRKSDHAGTDRKWALNIGIPFYTPEEYFLKLPAAPYQLQGFNVSSLPLLSVEASAVSPLHSDRGAIPQEIVLFVGYPSLGKSTFFRKHFKPADYVHINQDILGNRNKCIRAAEECLESGRSCVIDNTNRNEQTRKYYIDLAQKLDVPIRAYNLPESVANNEAKREVLPFAAFMNYQSSYEPPELSEGFQDIRIVNWSFSGTDEERQRWSMWLQIDGK